MKAFGNGNGKGKGRGDMDRVWREAWRSANDGFERFVFEARKTAERIDRRYSLSRRLSSVARAAADRAREIDREFEIGQRYRTFSIDFQRNWPKVSVCMFLYFGVMDECDYVVDLIVILHRCSTGSSSTTFSIVLSGRVSL